MQKIKIKINVAYTTEDLIFCYKKAINQKVVYENIKLLYNVK